MFLGVKLTPSHIYCVGYSATRYYNKMQTLRTLFEKHASLVCTRTKAALYFQNHVDTLEFIIKKSVQAECFVWEATDLNFHGR